MAPKPNVSEQRKEQILQAATGVFARLGIHIARMDDIAEAAGVSKGTLYLYYESKEAILVALLEGFSQRALLPVQQIAASDGAVAERLRLVIQACAIEIQQMAQTLPLLLELYATAARQEEARRLIPGYFARSHALWVSLVEEGIARGEFRPVDASETALILEAIFEGLSLLWLVNPEVVDWEKNPTAAVQLLLEGLLA